MKKYKLANAQRRYNIEERHCNNEQFTRDILKDKIMEFAKNLQITENLFLK